MLGSYRQSKTQTPVASFLWTTWGARSLYFSPTGSPANVMHSSIEGEPSVRSAVWRRPLSTTCF